METEKLTRVEAQRVRYAAELEAHVRWLDSYSAAAFGVLAVASGIYILPWGVLAFR